MSNLLKDASILLTPTGYDNGKMLSIKPEDGDGDFTFSRNSAATRVNAQGLVENVQILSSNLVQNGDFSQIGSEEVTNGSFSQEGSEQITNGDFSTDTYWSKGNGWSISGGSANCDGTQSGNSDLKQQGGILGATIDFVVGKTYKVNFDIVVTSGAITYIEVANGYDNNDITTSGNHTTYITAVSTNDRFQITANPDFIGSIDNVSVKEVGQDWSFTSGATLTDIGAKITHTPTAGSIAQLSILTIGKQYKLTYEITENVSGGLKFNSAVNSAMVTTVGVHTKYFEADGTTAVIGRTSSSNNDVTITNISVKEVGQNWSFGDGFTPDQANSKATCDGTQSAVTNLTQTISTNIQNKLVRVSFTLDYTAGVLLGSLSGTGAVDFNNITSSGTYTAEMTSNEVSPPLILQGDANFIGSITNIVLLEITNDTDLPRINYEGFSYQDALGSEQIVNGGFNDGSNWTTLGGWSIGGGSANCNGGSIMYTNGSIEVSKTYKVTYDIINYVSGNVRSIFNGTTTDGNGTTRNANGTFTELVQSTDNASGTFSFGAVAGSFIGSIDNVSVKEYLGQEVVPDSGCGSWLLEDESTNLVTQSETFSNWITEGGKQVVTTGVVISPDGTQNGNKLETYNSTSEPQRKLWIQKTVTVGASYTFSVYIKKVSSQLNTGFLHITTGANDTFDVSQSYTATEQWQRVSVTTNSALSSAIRFLITGDANSQIYIWGAQLEQQSYATSYIPTQGATSTRLRDIATDSGNSTLINSTEGVLYAEIAALANDGTTRAVSLSDATNDNTVKIQINTTTNEYFAQIRTDFGVDKAIFYFANVLPFNKIALLYDNGSVKLFINGNNVGDGVYGSFDINTLTTLRFDRGDTGNKFFGKLKALAVYKEALTDAELTLLTTI